MVRWDRLDQWVYLEVREPLDEMVPLAQEDFLVMLDHKDDKDLLGRLEPQEPPELQAQMDLLENLEIKVYQVLPAPKAIREKEAMFSLKPPSVPSLDKCASSSSRAICPVTTPS